MKPERDPVVKQPPLQRRFWTLLPLVATFLVLFDVVYLPDLLARWWMGYTGHLHLFAVDTTINYSPAQAYAVLTTYGSTGRRGYIAALLLFDFVFPFLYGSF